MRTWLSLIFLLMFVIPGSAAANSVSTNDSAINGLYPTEEQMNVQVPGLEMEYKKVPPEFYRWDSDLQLVEMKGIVPEFNNPQDVSDNTIASGIYRLSVQMVRFGVFILQMGFSTNLLVAGMDAIADKIVLISDHFMDKIFPTASLIMMIFVMVAWAKGQKSEMVRIFFGAFLVSALLAGGVKHVDTLARATSDVMDELSLTMLGILNLDGNLNDSAKTVGVKRLGETANMLWKVSVDDPWTAGQFGSVNAPRINQEETAELKGKNVTVAANSSWKDAFLTYAPGSLERKALTKVLADEDLPHSSATASAMMRELGPPIRIMMSILAFLNALGILLLFVIVAGLMLITSLLLLGGVVVSPIVVPFPFLARIGMHWVKKFLTYLVGSALLKVSSTVYLAVVMLFLYLLSLFNLHYLIIQGITLLILVLGLYLSPNIWRRMTPGIANISGVAERSTQQLLKKRTPEKIEDVFERFGRRRKETGTEDLLTQRARSSQLDATGTAKKELEMLKEVKQENPQQYAASGLAERENDVSQTLRKRDLSNLSLTQLQAQRRRYEGRLKSGEPLNLEERADLHTIQTKERAKIRGRMSPQEQKDLNLVWSQGRKLETQRSRLERMKGSHPMSFVRNGGELQLKHLSNRMNLNQQQESQLLENYLQRPMATKEEQMEQKELQTYLRNQGSVGIISGHLENTKPSSPGLERMTSFESMSKEELAMERQHMESQWNQEGLNHQEENELLYLQHQEWMSTMDGMEEKEPLEGLYYQELDIESELQDLEQQRVEDPIRFVQQGGEQKQQERQQSLYQTRQQSQEILRHTGHREGAELHLQHAQNRDHLRKNSTQPFNVKEQQLQGEKQPVQRGETNTIQEGKSVRDVSAYPKLKRERQAEDHQSKEGKSDIHSQHAENRDPLRQKSTQPINVKEQQTQEEQGTREDRMEQRSQERKERVEPGMKMNNTNHPIVLNREVHREQQADPSPKNENQVIVFPQANAAHPKKPLTIADVQRQFHEARANRSDKN